MAAAQAMWNSMSPEQRAQLQGLAESLLEDMDLRWQVDRLAGNLQQAFPDAGWEQRYRFSGDEPMGMGDATDAAAPPARHRRARGVPAVGQLAGRAVRGGPRQGGQAPGEDAARSLDRLRQLAKQLEDAGLIDQREGRFELTPHGIRRIGQQALADLFSQLDQGPGREPSHHLYRDRPRPRGDHQALRVRRPLQPGPLPDRPQRRPAGGERRTGPASPDDFEVIETEALTRSATVLLLDLSLSMPMRDNFVPAKKMALALHTLIAQRFPRDYLGLVGFSEVARRDRARGPADGQLGLRLRHQPAARPDAGPQDAGPPAGTKQIILVTDGEPTAHIVPYDGGLGYDVSFNYPPIAETLEVTLAEVMRCTKAGITINTFLLDPDRALQGFIEQLTRINQGRTFATSPGRAR